MPGGFINEDEVRAKSPGYDGSSQFKYSSPAFDQKSLNLSLTFEEALKLSCALQSALFEINRTNRVVNPALGVQLSIKRDRSQIAVIARPLKPVGAKRAVRQSPHDPSPQ